jgi:hypothetical protein
LHYTSLRSLEVETCSIAEGHSWNRAVFDALYLCLEAISVI